MNEWRKPYATKEIEGFKGYYVDTLGRALSDRNGPRKELKPTATHTGYLAIRIHNADCKRSFRIHRLVCLAFKPNENHKNLEVNHIDGNKSNNSIENLEWVSHKENMAHAGATGLMPWSGVSGRGHPKSRAVVCVDYPGGPVTFGSMQEAQRVTGICNAAISAACSGKQNVAGGYKWMLAE